MSKYQFGDRLFYRSNHTHEYLPVEVTIVFKDNYYQVREINSNTEIDYQFITEEKYLSKSIVGTADCNSTELPKPDFVNLSYNGEGKVVYKFANGIRVYDNGTVIAPLGHRFSQEERDKIKEVTKDDSHKEEPKEQALRFNEGKLPFDEIMPQFEEELAKVILYGQRKYGRLNWAKGAPFSQFYGCIRRHLSAIYKGEDYDKESSCLHLAHIAANLMMLHYNMLYKPENDDRVFKTKEINK